ncbi:hypothetical protein PDESU_04406 [Pontiella desulfatans]|uniref:Uncharacterized protein n=1 Tax=Pontiella desulfatans TaxID=2750659 RepID=A0A6C2U7H7_PONDE|nr:hypothetical protein [Pontiella desulfatans]VGO15819.1 hypothetical protein PDESU_04406 [Pontiella desulfatans]
MKKEFFIIHPKRYVSLAERISDYLGENSFSKTILCKEFEKHPIPETEGRCFICIGDGKENPLSHTYIREKIQEGECAETEDGVFVLSQYPYAVIFGESDWGKVAEQFKDNLANCAKALGETKSKLLKKNESEGINTVGEGVDKAIDMAKNVSKATFKAGGKLYMHALKVNTGAVLMTEKAKIKKELTGKGVDAFLSDVAPSWLQK